MARIEISNLLYAVAHPVDTLKAIVRGKENKSGGVRLEDWPGSVQKDMSKGQVIHPDGRHPEHPNI